MPTIDASVGGAASNSYLTLAEAQTYWDTRVFTSLWDDSDNQIAALILATRTLDRMLSGYREYVRTNSSQKAYFHTYPAWTGLPASVTQVLAWPRSGMLDMNGNAIATTVIPQALKDAVAELAGQMSKADRTIDSDIAVQGITSVKAGSVAVSFRNDGIETLKVLPDYVYVLLVPSWLADDIMSPAMLAEFDVIS